MRGEAHCSLKDPSLHGSQSGGARTRSTEASLAMEMHFDSLPVMSESLVLKLPPPMAPPAHFAQRHSLVRRRGSIQELLTYRGSWSIEISTCHAATCDTQDLCLRYLGSWLTTGGSADVPRFPLAAREILPRYISTFNER